MMCAGRKWQWLAIIFLLGIGIVPSVSGSYQVRTLMAFLFYLLLSQCFSLLGRKSGYLNLGQGVFVGLGAYASGLMVRAGLSWWISLSLAALTGVVVSLALALLLFRLSKEAFAIAGLALVYVCLSATNMLRDITGGTDGLSVPGTDGLVEAFFGLLFLSFGAMIIGFVMPRLRLGFQLELIGSDPAQAKAMGVPSHLTLGKIYVFCAFLLTLGGGLFMMGEGYLIPSTVFGLQVSLLPVAMAMVGGLRNSVGPLVGTALVFGVQEWLWSYAGGMEQTILGLLLILAGKRHTLIRLFFPRDRQ